MSQLQSRIEQTAKDYLKYKEVYEAESKKVNSKEFKEKLSKNSLDLKDKHEEIFANYFDELGSIELLYIDLNQLKIQLYHYIKLAEDLVEIPQEIKDLVSDYTPTYIYSITNGEKKIVDKISYDKQKENYIKGSMHMLALQKNNEASK